MPNNSCTVVLNGHGCYSKDYIVDVSSINYNIVFPCGMNEKISNGHHNLLLGTLITNVPNSLGLLELLPTSYISNNTVQQNGLVKNMFEKRTECIYDHGLSNASDVRDVQSLISIDNQRFTGYDVIFDGVIRQWNGGLNIEFDQIQVKNDVIQKHQELNYQYNTTINLSQNNIVYVKPIAPQNVRMDFKLSDLLSDILPKIKVPVSYHTNNTVDILPLVLLDDNTIQNKEQTFAQHYPNLFDNNAGDVYHELVITGDANIIWDACRDFV
jgi:hypothetical protein